MRNSFFDTYYNDSLKNLYVSLSDSLISQSGVDVYYIPRDTKNYDVLFGEDTGTTFTKAVNIQALIVSFSSFKGNIDLMTMHGLAVDDTLVISISRTQFADEVSRIYSFIRPREGDLIYFPFSKGLFEIKFVEHEEPFYEFGSLMDYTLKCMKYDYTNETFNTGISELDNIETKYSVGSDLYFILTENNFYLQTESGQELVQEIYENTDDLVKGQENVYLETEANSFIDFSVIDPFAYGGTT